MILLFVILSMLNLLNMKFKAIFIYTNLYIALCLLNVNSQFQLESVKKSISNNSSKKDENKDSDDPFKAIGIPELNPKEILEEIERDNLKSKLSQDLNTIEDLPTFIKTSLISDEEIMETLSRFLLRDDINLKPYGAIYDKTGHDGVESITELPIYLNERSQVRAKSSAILYVR